MNRTDRLKLRLLIMSAVIIGAILVIDELWMFGIPIGPILPDLSQWHIEPYHHWMVGVALLSMISYLIMKKRREVI